MMITVFLIFKDVVLIKACLITKNNDSAAFKNLKLAGILKIRVHGILAHAFYFENI